MIKIENLKVIYPNKYVALKNISIEIPDDKITCILGPNGAGKSTLLKAISKIIPFNGSILLNGIEVSKQPLKVISKLVSYATQVYVHELLSLTVYEALLIARYPVSTGFIEKEIDYKAVENIAKELFLEHLLKRKLSELSSGELQRVILAMALIKNPKILLFDELDAHVDIGVKALLSKLIRGWASKRTLIFTTHDILYGSSIGEYFIVLSNGELVFAGYLDDLVLNKELLEKIYGVKINIVEEKKKKLLMPLYV